MHWKGSLNHEAYNGQPAANQFRINGHVGLRRALGDAHATTLSCGAKLAHALVERGHACSDSVIAEAEDILWECLEAARAGGADDDVTAVALEKSLEETRRLYLAEEADDDGDKFT